mgnify:CR=1 FL=1
MKKLIWPLVGVGLLAGPAPASLRRLQLAADATESLARSGAGANGIELLIGPEGGLDDEERRAAERAGYWPSSLGSRVLRTETAAIAALALLQGIAGDLR